MGFEGFYSKINVLIYFMGLRDEGESIVVILKCDDKIQHTLVIDSFVDTEENNKIIEVLKDNKVTEIDALVWSHPHDDHTKGLLKLLVEYNNNIKEIFVPCGLEGDERKYSKEVIEVYQYINRINEENIQNKKLTRINQVLSDTVIVKNQVLKLKDTAKKDVRLDIFAVSPDSNLIRNRSIREKYEHINDFSIGLYYIIGDFVLFLSSDMENITINNLRTHILRQMIVPNILKLPHHGSESTTKLFEHFENRIEKYKEDKIDYIALTAFKRNKLPNNSILNGYKTISDKIYKINGDEKTNRYSTFSLDVDILLKTIKPIIIDNFIEHK